MFIRLQMASLSLAFTALLLVPPAGRGPQVTARDPPDPAEEPAANLAIIRGDALALVSFTTTDSRLQSDPLAKATLYAGNPQRAPDLTGAGHFTVDPAVAVGALPGGLVAGRFTSADPVRATTPP